MIFRDSISNEMDNRSSKDCKDRYTRYLSNRKRSFTKYEDEQIINLQKEFGNQWSKIASNLNGRLPRTVKHRWALLNKRGESLKKTSDYINFWSEEEDKLIISLYKEVRNNWGQIATHLPERTGSAIRCRINLLKTKYAEEIFSSPPDPGFFC